MRRWSTETMLLCILVLLCYGLLCLYIASKLQPNVFTPNSATDTHRIGGGDTTQTPRCTFEPFDVTPESMCISWQIDGFEGTVTLYMREEFSAYEWTEVTSVRAIAISPHTTTTLITPLHHNTVYNFVLVTGNGTKSHISPPPQQQPNVLCSKRVTTLRAQNLIKNPSFEILSPPLYPEILYVHHPPEAWQVLLTVFSFRIPC